MSNHESPDLTASARRLKGATRLAAAFVAVAIAAPVFAAPDAAAPPARAFLASTYSPEARAAAATAVARGGNPPPARMATASAKPRSADFAGEPLSDDARAVAAWVVDAADNRGLPFIVVDKVNARVAVFDADGRIAASTPALLGLARGDDSVPGIGERKMSEIKPHERTTPAGRFVAEIGVNANGEDILWVDYDAAVSMHRVRNGNKADRRLQRLASATVADNRISYGCINLPVAFYEQYVKRMFEARGGIVYVLPETRPVLAQFGAYRVAAAAAR